MLPTQERYVSRDKVILAAEVFARASRALGPQLACGPGLAILTQVGCWDGPCNIAQISQGLAMSPPTTDRWIHILHSKGYLCRTGPMISLSLDGAALLETLFPDT